MSAPLPVERLAIDGLRYYATPSGVFPSVTTILKATKEASDVAALEAWKARVGKKTAAARRTAGAARGDRVHRKAEVWLRKRGWELPEEAWLGDPRDGYWRSLVPVLRSVSGCLAVETFVWHAELRFAGALDAVLLFRSGKTYLVDWKTDGRERVGTESLREYRCQGAAYFHAAKSLGIHADGVAIVVAHEKTPAEPLFLPASHLEGAWSWFQKRAALFHASVPPPSGI